MLGNQEPAARPATEWERTELAEARVENSDRERRTSALLAIERLSMRFGGVTALENVTFDVAPRAICGLIGPNGAGKTTLFNCISRLYAADAGAVACGVRSRAAGGRACSSGGGVLPPPGGLAGIGDRAAV